MKITASKRDVQGSSASRRLRRASRVPAIVYGASLPPMNIELDHNAIYHALRKEEFHASILDMQIEGASSEQVLLRAVQWHAYKPQVLHVDFQRVDPSKVINTKVPLHFINADKSPAVKLAGAIITHVLNDLEVVCLPANLPPFIEVDLSQLVGGASLYLADITLPKGVSYVAHGGDTNPLLASALGATEDAAEAETEGTVAAP